MWKFLAGLFVGASVGVASAGMPVTVNSNGVLTGYVMQHNGKDICKDPIVHHNWLNGLPHYIFCDEE